MEMGRRVIGISGSLIWSKNLMELIFDPCGEFRWSPVDPISQMHSPHIYAGAPGVFSDLLRSAQMLKGEWGAESNWKIPCQFIPTKFRSWCVRLQWKTCRWQNTLMMVMMMMMNMEIKEFHKTLLMSLKVHRAENVADKFRKSGKINSETFKQAYFNTVQPNSAFVSKCLVPGNTAFWVLSIAIKENIYKLFTPTTAYELNMLWPLPYGQRYCIEAHCVFIYWSFTNWYQ